MKIKFKKILPILGLLSIGVAAPIISTACSSTSETPNNDSNTGGGNTDGDNTGQDGDGNNQQKPAEIKVNFTKFNEYFGKLNDATYTDLSQHIDPITNLVEQNHIKTFLTTNLGFSNDDADKVENVKVSLKEKAPASQGGGDSNGSLFSGTGEMGGGTEGTPKKLLNAEIVMTLKDTNIWNEEGLPESASVTEDKKTLTLKDVTTNVEIVEIRFSDDGTKLENEIKNQLGKLTDKTEEKKAEVEKLILDSLNGIKNEEGSTGKSSSNTINKIASKVVIELVTKDDASSGNTRNSSSMATQTKEKANVTIYLRGNVKFANIDSNTKFVVLEGESKTAIKTKNPIETGIVDNSTSQGKK